MHSLTWAGAWAASADAVVLTNEAVHRPASGAGVPDARSGEAGGVASGGGLSPSRDSTSEDRRCPGWSTPLHALTSPSAAAATIAFHIVRRISAPPCATSCLRGTQGPLQSIRC